MQDDDLRSEVLGVALHAGPLGGRQVQHEAEVPQLADAVHAWGRQAGVTAAHRWYL